MEGPVAISVQDLEESSCFTLAGLVATDILGSESLDMMKVLMRPRVP